MQYTTDLYTNSIFPNSSDSLKILKNFEGMRFYEGGVDNIDTKSLKTIGIYLVDEVTRIYNLCHETSIWPDPPKEADKYQLINKVLKYQTIFADHDLQVEK